MGRILAGHFLQPPAHRHLAQPIRKIVLITTQMGGYIAEQLFPFERDRLEHLFLLLGGVGNERHGYSSFRYCSYWFAVINPSVPDPSVNLILHIQPNL